MIDKTLTETKPALSFFRPVQTTEMLIPLITGVGCSFPNQADEFMHEFIDLNKELVREREATIFVRVHGNSMIDAKIEHDDVLVLDRGLTPENNKIVICEINREYTCKRIKIVKKTGEVFLLPENKSFEPIKLDPKSDEVRVIGVVTYIIHKAK